MRKPAGWTSKTDRPLVVDVTQIGRRQIELNEGTDQTTFSRRCLEFLQDCHNRGVTPDSCKAYGCLLKQFYLWVDGRNVTSEIFREFIEDLIYTKKRSTQWCRDSFMVVRLFFKWCLTKGYVAADPTVNQNFRWPPKRMKTETYTRQEYELMERAARGKPVWIAIVLAYHTGMRISDLMNLKWSAINWETQTIKFIPVKTRSMHSEVLLPFVSGSELAEALVQHRMMCPEDQEYVLPNGNSDHWRNSLENIHKAVGIPKGKLWHTFRRTFVTNLLSAGIDHFMVMKLTGLRNVNTVSHYAAPGVRALRDAMTAGANFGANKT